MSKKVVANLYSKTPILARTKSEFQPPGCHSFFYICFREAGEESRRARLAATCLLCMTCRRVTWRLCALSSLAQPTVESFGKFPYQFSCCELINWCVCLEDCISVNTAVN